VLAPNSAADAIANGAPGHARMASFVSVRLLSIQQS